MTLTAQQTGSLFWCHALCSSLMSAFFACQTCEPIVLLFPLLHNNNMTTNLQRFASTYSGRPFSACDCWTQTSVAGNAARQWLLIA